MADNPTKSISNSNFPDTVYSSGLVHTINMTRISRIFRILPILLRILHPYEGLQNFVIKNSQETIIALKNPIKNSLEIS